MYSMPCGKVTSLFIIIFGDMSRSCMRMQPLNLLDDVWEGPALMWLPEAVQDNTTFSCGLCSLQKVWDVLTSFLETLEARQACDVLSHALQTLWKFCEKVLLSCGLGASEKSAHEQGILTCSFRRLQDYAGTFSEVFQLHAIWTCLGYAFFSERQRQI